MFGKNETVCLLGDAPNLVEYNNFKEKGAIIIALNRAFTKQKADIHFFADRRYVVGNQETFDYNLSAIYPKCFNYPFKKSLTYNPVWEIDQVFKGRLKAGHSVLIPALHYVLMRQPKKVILFGVQLNNHDHWYGKQATETIFPCKNRVFSEVKGLVESFKNIPVFSGSSDSFLVSQGLINVYK